MIPVQEISVYRTALYLLALRVADGDPAEAALVVEDYLENAKRTLRRLASDEIPGSNGHE